MSEDVSEYKLDKANGQAAKWRHKYKLANDAVVALKAELEPLKIEYESIKSKQASKPSEVQAELDALRSSIRLDRHKATLERVAKEKNVAIPTDDLVKLLDYKADSDDVDESHVKELLESAIKAKPYLVTKPEPQKWEAGPGVSKGASSNAGNFLVRYSEASDPFWCMKNQKGLQEAIKNDTLQMIEG